MKRTSMSVMEVAKIFKKDPSWIRAGIIEGWLPIGTATRNGVKITSIEEIDSKRGRINYYISPKLVKEFTGWGGRL